MANAAMNNMFAMRRGGLPQGNPALLYAQQQRQNEMLKNQQLQQERRNKYLALQEEKLRQSMNPFYDYEQAIERGLIPPETTLAEFSMMGLKGTADPAAVREYAYYNSLDDEAKAEYLRMKRAGQTFGGPAGSTLYRGPDGGVTTLTTPEAMIEGAADKETAVQGASKSVAYDWSQVDAATSALYGAEEAYDLARSMRDTSQKYLDMLSGENPDAAVLDTGPVDAFLYDVFGVGTEEFAQMDADAIETTLQNLQITNLAPVTENELRQVGKMWANIARQETPNKGVLKRAIERSEAAMRRIERDVRTQGSRLNTYGPEGELDRLIGTSGFLKRVYGIESDDGTVREVK